MSEETIQEVSEETQEVQQEESQTEETSAEASSEVAEDLKEEVEKAIEEGASEEEVKEIIKEYTLKVNGKEFTKKLDLGNDDEIKRILQREQAGQLAMQEAAELKKLYASEIERLKSEPYKVLEELGLNADELAEKRIQERLEEMKKSPEEIEREKMQKELEEARRQLKEKEEKAAEEARMRLEQEAAQELDTEIAAALDAHQTLAASPFVVKKIADAMLWALDNGYEDVTAEDVVPTVEKELQRDVSELLDALPLEALQSFIGKQNIERLRKDRLEKVKQTNNVSNIQKTANPAPESADEKADRKRISLNEFMRMR